MTNVFTQQAPTQPVEYTVSYPAAGINSRVIGYTPEQIRAQLASQYAELANATPVVTNGVLTFRLAVGTKNVG